MSRDGAGGGRHALLHPFLPLLHDDTRPTTAAPTRPRPAALDAALATALESTHASPSAREAHSRATSHTSCTLSTEACANVRAHAPNNSNKIGRSCIDRHVHNGSCNHCQLPARAAIHATAHSGRGTDRRLGLPTQRPAARSKRLHPTFIPPFQRLPHHPQSKPLVFLTRSAKMLCSCKQSAYTCTTSTLVSSKLTGMRHTRRNRSR